MTLMRLNLGWLRKLRSRTGSSARRSTTDSRSFRQTMEDPALRTSSAFRGAPGAAIATTLLFAACAALHSVPPLRTDKVLFWRVRGPETVNSEAYLLGSVHVGRADRPLVLDQRLAEAFAAATELWVEVDPRK